MTTQRVPAAMLLAVAAVSAAAAFRPAQSPSAAPTSPPASIVWKVDNLAAIGGHRVTVTGTPRVVDADGMRAVEFDGATDGLFLDVNPLAGLGRFTIDVVFAPAPDGGEEQRFLHFQELDSTSRVLVELRMLRTRRWSLDTYLRRGDTDLTLLDRSKTHAAGPWHVATLSYDGKTMSHAVDGVRELTGDIAFGPLGAGRTSIGVRLNRVSWFKGRIAEIRITPGASTRAVAADLVPASDAVAVPRDAETVVARSRDGQSAVTWGRGFEGQRKADLGNGYYLNPIMAGDHPDPSILRVGADYYMTFSSFDAYPGLVIWHSRDLVNWEPIGPALRRNVGSVWAPDLVEHRGRYYIYFPGIGQPYRSNYVVWADDIRGPWSDPVDLKIGRIDPGHAVAADGRRYLFLSGGYRVALSEDGLAIIGEPEKVYDGWRYPEDWIVEGFAQEGPKIVRRGRYYYMVLAEGGTAGPPTGHMIVAARAATLDGPWENSPHNPIVRTRSADERWWSKGHGTLVETADGRWFVVYHGYENGFYNLGRQTLLEPVEWTADGWFRTTGADIARPLPKPPGTAVAHGFPFSDDFSTDRMGIQWSFYKGTESDRGRYRLEGSALVLRAKGTTPADSSPLWFVTGDHAYEVEVEIEADPEATAGLLLFYSSRLYAGLGYSAGNFILHRYGTERLLRKPPEVARVLHLRVRNDRHIVTIHYSADGRTWKRFENGLEVSGYHHNVAYDFLSLRPALYAAGTGEVRFRHFRYRALP